MTENPEYIRKATRRDYTTIDNELLSSGMSLTAIGLASVLLSQTDDVRAVNVETIAATFSEGRDRIRAALRELAEAGYLLRVKMRDKRGRIRTQSWLADYPRFAHLATGEARNRGEYDEPELAEIYAEIGVDRQPDHRPTDNRRPDNRTSVNRPTETRRPENEDSTSGEDAASENSQSHVRARTPARAQTTTTTTTTTDQKEDTYWNVDSKDQVVVVVSKNSNTENGNPAESWDGICEYWRVSITGKKMTKATEEWLWALYLRYGGDTLSVAIREAAANNRLGGFPTANFVRAICQRMREVKELDQQRAKAIVGAMPDSRGSDSADSGEDVYLRMRQELLHD